MVAPFFAHAGATVAAGRMSCIGHNRMQRVQATDALPKCPTLQAVAADGVGTA